MFNISKHIFPHLKFHAVIGSPEPRDFLAAEVLDEISDFVAQTDVAITALAVMNESWAMCDITKEPSLCYQVEMSVLAHAPTLNTPKPKNYYQDALHIQGGACNPRAIVRSIHDMLKGPLAEADTRTISNDPAIRLMVHQLAYIVQISALDNQPNEYHNQLELCGKLAMATARQNLDHKSVVNIAQQFWPSIQNEEGAFLSEEGKSQLKVFLEKYPDGQQFEMLYSQFGICDVSGKTSLCYMVQTI